MFGSPIPLATWSWFFLALYVGMMLLFGYVGMRRVKSGDDFAVARASYGPLFLALAIVATSASGGTFLGLPALAYEAGVSAMWYALVYPLAIYLGFMVSLRIVRRVGERFGNRSIPEYLGDRFQSESLRVVAAVFSLLLLFYLAAQLLAAAVLFTNVMGIPLFPALIATSLILFVYIVIGGAHADILTDGVQGALMLLLAALVTWMFISGFGVSGDGAAGIMSKLHAIDPDLTKVLHPTHPILNSWWDVIAIAITHAPAGLLPHIGNKLWALKRDRDQRNLLIIAFLFAMLLAMLTLGGLIARAVLGDALFADGANPNEAIPVLFTTLMPAWLAALIGTGVLAAVMSTADGLVISSSQIFANDIYRRTIVPLLRQPPDDAIVDRYSLIISRVAIVLVMLAAVWLAWESQALNVAVLVWSGVGGLMAATAGPMFLGALWERSTRAGALVGFISGGSIFIALKAGAIKAQWFSATVFASQAEWLAAQAVNPFSCAALATIASLILMTLVSLCSKPLEQHHVDKVFGRA